VRAVEDVQESCSSQVRSGCERLKVGVVKYLAWNDEQVMAGDGPSGSYLSRQPVTFAGASLKPLTHHPKFGLLAR
jgi:hypothetical protein